MKGRSFSRAEQRGFTFVELLVVVILVGMIAAVSMVSIRTFLARYQLDSAARNLTAFLNSVPAQARKINAPVFLIWRSSSSQFIISRDSTGTQTLDDFKIDTAKITFTPPTVTTLRCDVLGRVFIGTATAMMSTAQVMTLTHARVQNPAIKTVQLTIPPLWAVLATTL